MTEKEVLSILEKFKNSIVDLKTEVSSLKEDIKNVTEEYEAKLAKSNETLKSVEAERDKYKEDSKNFFDQATYNANKLTELEKEIVFHKDDHLMEIDELNNRNFSKIKSLEKEIETKNFLYVGLKSENDKLKEQLDKEKDDYNKLLNELCAYKNFEEKYLSKYSNKKPLEELDVESMMEKIDNDSTNNKDEENILDIYKDIIKYMYSENVKANEFYILKNPSLFEITFGKENVKSFLATLLENEILIYNKDTKELLSKKPITEVLNKIDEIFS